MTQKYYCICQPSRPLPLSADPHHTVKLKVRFCVQGVLSPVLANIHLHAVDEALEQGGIRFVRYADDIVLLAPTPFAALEARAVLESALAGRGLILHTAKTRIGSFDQGFRFLGAELDSERILIPFEKKKTPRKPVFVAPVMPPALRRAYRSGGLPLAEWVWHPRAVPVAGPARRGWPANSQALRLLTR